VDCPALRVRDLCTIQGDGGGDLVINATGHLPAPNDDFDSAAIISSLPFNDTVDAAAATVAPDDPTDCAGTDVHTVWYAFTPPRMPPL
jgi:hypothetical protein